MSTNCALNFKSCNRPLNESEELDSQECDTGDDEDVDYDGVVMYEEDCLDDEHDNEVRFYVLLAAS